MDWKGIFTHVGLALLFCSGMYCLMQFVSYTEIPEAVKFNDLPHVRRIIREFTLFDIKPYILCEAAKYGQMDILNHLIELKVDLQAFNKCAYHIALENRHHRFAEFVMRLYTK